MSIRHIRLLYQKYKSMNIAVKASLWFALCSILQKGISVITLPIFTRLMPTNQFGQYSIFQTWYNILILIVTLNIQSEIFNKGLITNSEAKDKYTANQVGLLLTLSSIFLGIYLIFKEKINQFMGLTTFLMLVMLIEILANAIIALWSARKRFDYEYLNIVTVTIISSILNPVVGVIAVVYSSDKAQARIVSNAVIPLLTSVVILVSVAKKGKLFSNYGWWKTAVIGSLPLIPHYLSLILLNQSDKLMINHFCGPEDAAIYSVAHSAGLLMTIVNTSINGSFVPWVYTKLKANDTEDIHNVTLSLSASVLFCNVLLVWFAPEAIRILAAPQYSMATYCLVPIATSVFFFFVYTIIVDIEIYYGNNHYVAIASVIAAILNLVLNYIFIPKYGFLAAGYTTLVSYCFTMVIHCLFLKKIQKNMKSTVRIIDYKNTVLLAISLILIVSIAITLYSNFVIRLLVALLVAVIFVIYRNKILSAIRILKKK